MPNVSRIFPVARSFCPYAEGEYDIVMQTPHGHCPCILALEDGTVLTGRHFGAAGTKTGEVVFNTAMTGYQEILTDPSYYGQIVAMTCPQIGNYGVNPEDVESGRPQVFGFVIKELSLRPSSHRATEALHEYLSESGIIGLEGVDTRALTRKIRVDGAMRGCLTTEVDEPAECVRLAAEAEPMSGAELVRYVAPKTASAINYELQITNYERENRRQARTGSEGSSALPTGRPRRVVAIDCGMKRNILRRLAEFGCGVEIVPPQVGPGEILSRRPDGVFISNGPGDPAAVGYAVELIRGLIGKTPLFGICLGSQLLSLALGAETFKLKFGHRGANQPVKNLGTGRVEITSQNHGFATETESLVRGGGKPTHVNLNDGTLEGFVHEDLPILAVQYHPEASPGPHDATYLFDCFKRMMTTGVAPSAEEMAEAQAALQRRKVRVDAV